MARNKTQMENWLKEGKKVRRPCWLPESYWVLGGFGIILYSDGTLAKIHLNQLSANDWEVVEDDFCLEDEERRVGMKRNEDYIYVYHEKDIKKATSLTKSDLQRAKGHDGRVDLKYALKIIKKRFGERLV